MKLLKWLWNTLGDDRLALILAGVCLATALTQLKAGDYSDAAFGIALAAVVGGFAWRDLGRAVRS